MSKNLLLKVSGSIAAFKTATIASHFAKQGWSIKVVMTDSAQKFIGATTFEGLTGEAVLTDLWHPGDAMAHIHLDRWADIILLCPASATTINKMASGIADNLLTNLFLAHDFKKPYYIAPAMNTQMWRHPTTQASLQKLTEWGIQILQPGSGMLACGESGDGRLLEPSEIIQKLETIDENKPKVLVTLGGTEEPIDGVRVLANTSTGSTGVEICSVLKRQGFHVTALASRKSGQPQADVVHRFTTVSDLETHLQRELTENHFLGMVHAAAISDFQIPAAQAGTKVSSGETLHLELVPREKTVSKLRGWSKNSDLKVVAFKLTVNEDQSGQTAASMKMINSGDADIVVANDLSKISSANHDFRVITAAGDFAKGETKSQMGHSISDWLKEQIK